MDGSGVYGLKGMLQNLPYSVTNTVLSYFSKPVDDKDTSKTEDCDIDTTEEEHETTTEEDEQSNKNYESIKENLQDLYGDVAGVVVRQVTSKLRNDYYGNEAEFMTDFFYPAVNLLRKLKKAERKKLQKHYPEKEVCDDPGYLATSDYRQHTCYTSNHSNLCDSGSEDLKTACKKGVENIECCQTNCRLETSPCSNCDSITSDHLEKSIILCDNWPLAFRSGVVVNFQDLGTEKFKSGDLYFFVIQSSTGEVGLWVKCLLAGREIVKRIPDCDFGKVFTMDWNMELLSDCTEDLGEGLRNCLVVLEDSIQKLRWEDMLPSSSPFNHGGVKLKQSNIQCSNATFNNNCVKCDNLSENMDSSGTCCHGTKSSRSQNGHSNPLEYINRDITNTELRSRGMDSTDGREADTPRSPRSQGLHQHRHLEPPKTILDVDYKLLQSGVTILPGCRDLDGNVVLLIFTSSSLWKNQQVSSTDLARLIMYYFSVPRETVRCRGLTIIADIRGSSTSTINTLLESLYLFEGNQPQAISVVHLLADKHTQSLVLKSPIYDVHAAFQIDLLLSSSLLYSYISADQLPPVLEGSFQYNHEDWIRFHMRLDPFLSSCRSVARYLANVIQELSVIDQVPASATEASHLVNHHENLIKAAFEDPRVKRLQHEGDSMLKSLEREEVNIGHTDDYRYAMEDISRLYRHVQDTVMRLMRLSDTRLHRLEKCLQLKEFDEECSKIISWLHTQGNECLQRHLVMADNLKSVRVQQKDFEKFYFAAVTHIEKGNDLLEEASSLAQSGDFDEVTGYKELARMLKRHLQQFSERLEEARERIEGTTKCYQLLDKTYEWALEAMKYVASMKMEHCATPEGLDKLLRSLELYLAEHPPIADDIFTNMSDISKKLNNEKLLEQCQTAQNRCLETQKMLTLRGNTLKQFKDQLENESSAKLKSTTSLVPNPSNSSNLSSNMCTYSSSSAVSQPKSDINSVPTTGRTNINNAKSNSHWEPKDTSTPVVPKTYSRTMAERSKSGATLSTSSSSATSSPSHSIISPSSPCYLSSSPCPSSESSPAHVFTLPQPVGPKALSRFQDQNHDLSHGANLTDNTSLRDDQAYSRVLTDSNLSKENLMAHDSKTENRNLFLTPNDIRNCTQNVGQGQGYYSDSKVIVRNRPAKKVLKRAISTPQSGIAQPILEEDSGAITDPPSNRLASLRQNGRTDSMITGSTDSLPSLPEEDEVVLTSGVEDGSYVRHEYTPVPVNTHLTEQLANTPSRPLGDLKLTDAEVKSRRTLSLIMSEMIQTERDYVCSLRFIIEHYVPEMEREDVPQALRGKRNVIFGNIEKIFQFHQQFFLQEMEASKRNPFLIARYFLMHEKDFHLYTLYNKNKPRSDGLMAEYGKHFFRQKQLELGDKMDLSSYLLKPVQRMGKYALMIKQVLKECPNITADYQDLKDAEEMVRFQLRHGNDLLAMDALKECDVNILEQGRLLRQDEFLVYQGRRKFMRHIFLFEDLILFSKTKRGRNGGQDTYLYKHSFKMSDVGITQDYEGSGYKFEIWWRRMKAGDRFVLQAPSSELKKCWVRDVTRLLWNQAIKNRENRLSELATMGIGNKPCLDIKPSSDNIHDRFINIGNRARTRNSIAVCNTDLLSQGNKRPHSIISVSSNSSSNSSHSGVGAMNLAFNPVDSPRTYRKSLTFLSTESGIGTSIASGDSTMRYDTDLSRAQSPPPYADFARTHVPHPTMDREFVKPRVINLTSHTEEVTDI